MPELPEVQTIVGDLKRKIKGDIIIGFWSDWSRAIKGISGKFFSSEIKGRKILDIKRKGKNIFIDLSGGKTIYIHLKMTGHLLVKRVKSQISNYKLQTNQKNKNQNNRRDYFDERVNQYIHHIWHLKVSGSKGQMSKYNKTLEFSDLRKFGKIILVDTERIGEIKEIKKLGVDAISKEFTLNQFRGILLKRSRKLIGEILIDQELISGIGNIYRSEILFEAGILPQRRAENLSDLEAKKLYKAISKILQKAIRLRGTSDSDYRDTTGAPGNFQKVLNVYQREGLFCRKCKESVKRIKMGQRSVFYCPNCQR